MRGFLGVVVGFVCTYIGFWDIRVMILLTYSCLGRCNDEDGGQKVLAWVAPWLISHIHISIYSMCSQYCEAGLHLLWLGR
jgi:hypothetical protein